MSTITPQMQFSQDNCKIFYTNYIVFIYYWKLALNFISNIRGCSGSKNVGARKKRQVSNSVASSKKLEPENLDAITCSYKIVLCQACKFYHSWRQLWSHDTVVLLLVTCQKGKLLFIMIFSVILDVLFTLGPFSCWKWNRNFVWEQQPEVYLQSVNKEWFRTSVTDCDLSWLTRKYFDSRWYLLFHGLLSACYRYEDLIYL